jgi:hypothetical protein
MALRAPDSRERMLHMTSTEMGFLREWRQLSRLIDIIDVIMRSKNSQYLGAIARNRIAASEQSSSAVRNSSSTNDMTRHIGNDL